MKATCAGRFLVVAILAGLLTSSLAIAQKDDQAEVLMQAAHQKQLVEGQLEQAIQLYKRIVQEHPGNRVVAAKALLEMGQCYEKLGNTEARKAYERLLRDYGDQNEPAAQARARLAALTGNAASGGSQMMARRVWAGPDVHVFVDVHVMGSLSPDGRYLSCVDATTGDLALRDLVTGKMRRLTNEGSRPEVKAAAISRDGKEVAYNWPIKGGYPDLRVVRVDGSAPRVLYSVKGKGFAAPYDWSPDGKYVLTRLYIDPNILQIAVISKEDGSVHVLKTLDGLPTNIKFSADGRYIAYDLQQRGTRDIFLLAADGSREIHLIQHPADDQLLGWTPDGNHILFASDRSGTMSAWMIRVADGKPQGSPELVKPDIGRITPIGFTPAGSFYYGLTVGTGDVYTAEFDLATGKVLTDPQIATQRYVGWNISPAWSPDGQYLAYISRKQRPEIITIRSLKTGEERDLSPKLPFMWGPIRWSPDGRSIIVSGKDSKARHGLFVIDAQTAKAIPLEMWQGMIDISAFFPDGKRLLYRSWEGEAGALTQTILVRDLESGRETEFFRPTPGVGIYDIALSPDGQQVAVTLQEKETRSSVLKVLPIAGGDARELVRAKEPEAIVGDPLSWSSDSGYIVFGKVRATGQERKTEVLAIPSRGGEAHALGLAMDPVRDVSFHPDGHRLAFGTSAGVMRGDKDKVEIWMMENFLPTLKAARRQP